MKSLETTLLLCAAQSPVLLGIYTNESLLTEFADDSKTDIALVNVFARAFEWLKTQQQHPTKLIIARGPGSNTALKLSYLFAQTIAIASKIPVFGVQSFALNANQPIFAFGQSYYVNHNGTITLEKNHQAGSFALPKTLANLAHTQECEPLYVLSPLG